MGKVKNAEGSRLNISAAGGETKHQETNNAFLWDIGAGNRTETVNGMPASREDQTWWSRLLSYTNDIVFTASIDGRISFVNDSGLALLGYAPEEIYRQPGLVFVRQDYVRQAMRAFCQMLHFNAEGTARVEVPVIAKNGQVLWLDVEVYLTGESAPGRAICGIARNITLRKKKVESQRQRLERARLLAEESVDAHRDFLGNLSHEIRNPINSIVGMTNLLEDTELDRTQREYLDHIQYASELLLALISDVLDFTKIAEGKMEPCKEVIDLEKLVSRLAAATRYGLRGKKVVLECYIDPAISFPLWGDATFLHQVLLNLLGNAVKFTQQGSIILEARLLEAVEEAAIVQFSVSDTGIGIPPDKLPEIFDRFSQMQPHGHRRSGGIGLGLPITKRLVELLGGHIEVESTVGQGTCFQFVVPFERVSAPEALLPSREAPAPGARLPALRVLIAEDNPVNRIYLEQTLQKWGMPYVSAANGKEALDYLREEQFDLLLLDIRMPVLDGLETLTRLRSLDGHPNQHMAVIALTGAVSVEERTEALEAGVDCFLPKPFTPGALDRAVRRVWTPAAEKMQTPGESLPEEPINPNLLEELYAGDKRHARIVLELFLKNTPRELGTMEKYLEEADLEAFSAVLHKIKPNFRMAGLDGLEELAESLEEAVETAADFRALYPRFAALKYRTEKAMGALSNLIQQF